MTEYEKTGIAIMFIGAPILGAGCGTPDIVFVIIGILTLLIGGIVFIKG